MTGTAKKMFKDMGYEYSEKYTDDDEKVLEYIQYKNGYETIKFYIRGKFWGKSRKKGTYCAEYEYAYATMEETEAIVQQCKELGWITEQSNVETNYEHYKNEITEIFIDSLAIVDGKPAKCSNIDCLDCDFRNVRNMECCERVKEWLKNVYKKSSYKLTQFEYDLINTYCDCDENCKFEDCQQLKRLKEKGYFRNIDNYTLIKDVLECSEIKKGGKENEVHC